MTPAWLLSTFTQTADIYARTPIADATDEYGNPVYESLLVGSSPCRLAPLANVEIQFGRAGTETFVLYLPAESAALVDTFSAFVIDGADYEAEGPPQLYTELFSPTLHHVEVNLIRSSA